MGKLRAGDSEFTQVGSTSCLSDSPAGLLESLVQTVTWGSRQVRVLIPEVGIGPESARLASSPRVCTVLGTDSEYGDSRQGSSWLHIRLTRSEGPLKIFPVGGQIRPLRLSGGETRPLRTQVGTPARVGGGTARMARASLEALDLFLTTITYDLVRKGWRKRPLGSRGCGREWK